ncbi:hypothetical protein [Piscibacillus halophilus]|uniref:Uncharacterized protein n=1 Tax=Piscibacillus halophilus TaxID=571933 RepID=A0A1H9JJN0_9BACI|nr:hypothetical protein [Piscibacillus halophilus]SEQ86983.1 hypothetical protein SAMN05216362_13122 [Piscibacillus halophilus]
MMEFLYFPEDKTAYIPAVLTLLIFMTIAVLSMRMIIKKAKREQENFESQYPEGKREPEQPR